MPKSRLIASFFTFKVCHFLCLETKKVTPSTSSGQAPKNRVGMMTSSRFFAGQAIPFIVPDEALMLL
jgi:hypothetical protein